MLINSKTAVSLSLALGLATVGLTGFANAKDATSQAEYLSIQDQGNRDSIGLAPVHGNAQVNHNGAASAFARATSRGSQASEPQYQRYQDQGNRDSNGF
jgi:hypothetical protein